MAKAHDARLTRAVAENLFRVMAYKDEYEVARMHAAASYGEAPVFYLSPPLGQGLDKATGRRRKLAIPGRIAVPLFRVLRHGKRLRGTPIDPFGRQEERRWERALIGEYMTDVRTALAALRPDNADLVYAIAALPDMIRGFGPVKEANRAKAMERRAMLFAKLKESDADVAVSAERALA